MNSLTPPFDKGIFYLGSICKRGHDWEETNHSLRYKSTQTCIECRKFHAKLPSSLKNRERYFQEKREEILLKNRERYLLNPEKYKLQSKIYNEKSREKINARQREYYQKHRKECLEKIKRHYQANKQVIRQRQNNSYILNPAIKERKLQANRRRKALKKGNHHYQCSHGQLKERMKVFGGCCAYCGINPERLTLDHFLPVSFNGPDCLGNYLPACSDCNLNKRNQDPKQWFESKPFYSKRRWFKILKVLGKTDANYNQMPLI